MCGRASNAGVFVYWVACEYSCVCVGGWGAVLLTIDKCLNWVGECWLCCRWWDGAKCQRCDSESAEEGKRNFEGRPRRSRIRDSGRIWEGKRIPGGGVKER